MTNDHIKSEIGPYLAGGLTESRNRQIEAHAAACEKCRSAMAKARAKQARVKREALKKASPDPLPNLFLARQGKEAGAAYASSNAPWKWIGLILVVVGGYWAFHHFSLFSHAQTAPMPEQESAPVETSSAAVTAVEKPAAAQPVVNAEPAAVHAEPPKPLPPLEVQKEWKGVESGIKEDRLVVIRNKEAWGKLWTEMQSTDPLPEINFEKHVVLGVFSGDQPVGSSIVLGKIRETDDEVSVPYRIMLSGVQSSSATATAPTHPYLLSLIPHVDKKIRMTQKEASQ